MLIFSAFCASCNKREDKAPLQTKSDSAYQKRDNLTVLQENGGMRVELLKGLSKEEAPLQIQTRPEPLKINNEEATPVLVPTEATQAAKEIQIPNNAARGQTPMMRANVRSQAMEEMIQQKKQAGSESR